MKTYTIKINQEQANYLQRLGIEVEGKSFLIDRMFANHAMDEDTMLFDSVPFKHFMSEFEKAKAEFDLAKTEFQNTFLDKEVAKITGKEDNIYSWQIDDYSSLECKVVIS